MSAMIREKLGEINVLCTELADIVPPSMEVYLADKVVRAACERYLERIVEGLTDLAFMVIKAGRFRTPEDDRDAFSVLDEEGVIAQGLCGRLRQAKGMRNVLAHQYTRVDDRIVFKAITVDLPEDTAAFSKAVWQWLGP